MENGINEGGTAVVTAEEAVKRARRMLDYAVSVMNDNGEAHKTIRILGALMELARHNATLELFAE